MHEMMQFKRKKNSKYWNSACLVPKVCRTDSLLCHNKMVSFCVETKNIKNHAYLPTRTSKIKLQCFLQSSLSPFATKTSHLSSISCLFHAFSLSFTPLEGPPHPLWDCVPHGTEWLLCISPCTRPRVTKKDIVYDLEELIALVEK